MVDFNRRANLVSYHPLFLGVEEFHEDIVTSPRKLDGTDFFLFK